MTFVYCLIMMHIASSTLAPKGDSDITLNYGILNPTVVPMIQRYRKIFDAYEQQNGLTPFYLQKK